MSTLDSSIFILYWMIAAAIIVGTVFLLPKLLKKMGGSDELQGLFFIATLCTVVSVAVIGYWKIDEDQGKEVKRELQSQQALEQEDFIRQAHPPLLESLKQVARDQSHIQKNLKEWQLLSEKTVLQKKLIKEMSALMSKENTQLAQSLLKVQNALSTAWLYRQTGNEGHVDKVFVLEAKDMDSLLRESHADFQKGADEIRLMVGKRLVEARKPLEGKIKTPTQAARKRPEFKFLRVYVDYLEYFRKIEPELASQIDNMLRQSHDSVINYEKWKHHKNPDYAKPIKQVRGLWERSGFYIVDILNKLFGALEMEYIAYKVGANESIQEMAELKAAIRKAVPLYHKAILANREIVEKSYGPHFSPK